MRIFGLSVLIASAALCGGCLQSTALIKVNADGSGTIEHETLMGAAALAQVRQLAGVFGGNGAKSVDLFSEGQARDLASTMGDGVTLMSSTPLNTPAGEGRANVYAFRDIGKVRFTEVPTPGDLSIRTSGLGIADIGTVAFDLRRLDGGTALLTLHLPGNLLDLLGSRATTESLAGRRSATPADQFAMLRQTMAGVRLSIRLEPAGQLIRTSSPYVNGKTVTLFDLNMDELLKEETTFTRLMNAKTAEERASALRDAPGFKINLEREVTIEFAP